MLSSVFLFLAVTWAAPGEPAKGRFEYDRADETVAARLVGGENAYDPHVVVRGETVWQAWLEFEPGRGDRIWVGRRADAAQMQNGAGVADGWAVKTCVTPEAGIYKNPTLAVEKAGGFWLTYEQQQREKWSVAALRIVEDKPAGDPVAIGPGINHRTASVPDGGIWVVWQSPSEGQFDVVAALLDGDGVREKTTLESGTAARMNEWQPDVAVLANGDVQVTWDGRETSHAGFDVYACIRRNGQWERAGLIAAEEAFEGRPRVVADPRGRAWAVWEEGSANWGERYVSRMRKLNQQHLEMTDPNGPLHAFRRLRLARLDGVGGSPVDPPLPMPAFDELADRPNPRDGVERLGGYYERPELAVDGLGRMWVAYRHYYLPWVGVEKTSHVQQDWGVYARCFDGKDWSKLFRCDIGQGDGMQRLSIAPLPDGIVLAYTTGRTDRRPGTSPPGIAMALVRLPGQPTVPGGTALAALISRHVGGWDVEPAPAAAEYQVFFGDLHRHTDLSLCYVPTDGTMDDTYRYAIDVAKLDFLGITDHSRDIADGNAKSLLWWRCRKEVSRHDLSPSFIPMYAYEHSRGGEDHNVISLKPVLWPDTMPFPELWRQMDDDAFSIPHQTLCKDIPPDGEMPFGLDAKTWGYGDNRRRPLLEIYQGCRDRAIERDAHAALGKGHILGFIASSDHLSTNASFAGVWAKERTREAIFRAMQARRTFGATDRIRLKVTMGEHWMGEKVAATAVKPIRVECEGTASIEQIDVIADGKVVQSLPQGKQQVAADIKLLPFAGGGVHYFYIRVRQVDGNQAWSSPIWIE